VLCARTQAKSGLSPAYRARSRVRRVSKAEAPKRIRTSDPRQRRNGRREQGESSFLLSAPEGESTAQPRELRHRLGKKLSEKVLIVIT